MPTTPDAANQRIRAMAFAKVYRAAGAAIADGVAGRKPPKAGYDFPTIEDGLAGMAFIETVVKSGKAGAKWMKWPRD